ncbi:unnamed protein product, partial [marine sediment metagenome]
MSTEETVKDESKTEETVPTSGIPKGIVEEAAFEALKLLEEKMAKDAKAEDETAFGKVGRGDLSMVEYLVWSDRKDRIEERRREERLKKEHNSPGLTAEDIGIQTVGAVRAVLKEEGVIGKGGNKPEEKSETIKNIEKKYDDLILLLKGQQEDKKLTAAIKAAVDPLQTQLNTLSKSPSEGTVPKKSKIEEYVAFGNVLKSAGFVAASGVGAPDAAIARVKVYGDVIGDLITKAGKAGAFGFLERLVASKPPKSRIEPSQESELDRLLEVPERKIEVVAPEEASIIVPEGPVEAAVEVPVEVAVEETIETPVEVPIEAPVEEAVEVPVEVPVVAPETVA